jgi:predicted ferric reductase
MPPIDAQRNARANPVVSLVPARGDLGPLTIGLLVIAYAVFWLLARPAGEPARRHVGQLLGVESVLLLSIALVLISTLAWVEVWFHGIDRAAIWHRRVAIAGLVLIAPHVLLASNPRSSAYGPRLAIIGTIGLGGLAVWSVLPRWRDMAPPFLRRAITAMHEARAMRGVRRFLGGYERWRVLHRTTGLFVAAGFLHGLLDATAFPDAPLLRWSYVAIGGIGLAFYAYRELVARYVLPMHDYQVAAVTKLDTGLFEIALAPVGEPLRFLPGQFAMVFLEAKDGWHRHPFTIASAPHEAVVRVTVKALGDYTTQLETMLTPGMPAVISGPHGRFDRRGGTDHQVWIGAGVGVAPFLSWVRSLEPGFAQIVDFFYTADGDAPFGPEVLAIAARHPSLRVHLVNTRTQGRLTPDAVLAAAGVRPDELTVYMCGPQAMVGSFQRALRRAGVPRSRIYHEYFNWR